MKPRFEPGPYFRQSVGIDIGKHSFFACLTMLDVEGCSTPSIEFRNDKTGFNQLIRWIRREMLSQYPISFVMEPTGVYYEALAMHLSKLGHQVHVVPADRVRYFARYEGYSAKTDKIDAYVLSILGCDRRRLRPWQIPNPLSDSIRSLSRLRTSLVKQHTMLKNQYEALSHSALTPSKTTSLCRKAIASVKRNIEAVEEEMEIQMNESAQFKELMEYATSVPGIGRNTATIILAETNMFANFTSQRQLISYAGLNVVPRQSGTQDPKRSISKKGNVAIRTALYNCAMAAIGHNDQMRSFFERIKKSNPAGKVAITALMRKLLILVYTMCKNKTLYSSEYNVNV